MAETALAIAEPRPTRVPLVAGNSPRAIVPTDFEGAWRISQAVVAAQMAPKSLKTIEACAVAILHGLEIGLTPMNALQSIAVINGRPSLWGDGAIGVIQASGLIEDQDEHFEGDENTDNFKAVCILKRKGKARPYVGEFSIADARKAGLLGKEGPWQGYRKRMMKMRARAFAMRDGFSDVLKGMSVAEEQEDVDRATVAPAIDDGGGPPAPTPANDDGGGPPVPNQSIPDTEPENVTDDGGGPPAPADDGLDIPDYLRRSPDKPPISADEQRWLDGLEAAFGSCRDAATLFEQNDELMQPEDGNVSTEAWNAACDLLERHIQRLQE
jgi:hypothetical protein